MPSRLTHQTLSRVSGNVAQLAALIAAAALGALLLWLLGADEGVLGLLPILVLAMPLVMRRYPGERVLRRLISRSRSRWPRPRSTVAGAKPIQVLNARGGLLLGWALAVRPPPVACWPTPDLSAS